MMAAFCLAGGLACTSQEASPPGTGGTAGGGSGGSTTTPPGSGGSTSTVATTTPAGGEGTLCPPPQQMLTDFTYTPSDAGVSTSEVRFGSAGTLQGGESYYPNSGATPLTVDVTQGSYHITGTVGDYSGFALYFDNCDHLDASAFTGISFDISGTVQGSAITMGVGTLNDTTTAAWLKANGKTDANLNAAGKCTPTSNTSNQYYHPGCGDPTAQIPVTSTVTTVSMAWNKFTGGTPDASPNPKEITSIGWILPWSGTGATQYAVDLTIDNLQFTQ